MFSNYFFFNAGGERQNYIVVHFKILLIVIDTNNTLIYLLASFSEVLF